MSIYGDVTVAAAPMQCFKMEGGVREREKEGEIQMMEGGTERVGA